MSSKNIRTAQFGGVGGGGSGSPFSPGKSPIGRGGTNRGGGELNIYMDEDDNLEKIISRVHLDLHINNINDDNIEKQLTPQHRHNDGELNYHLDASERMKLKFRMQLQSYKKSLEEHADSILKNSPKYIKEHFQPKEEHMTTLEEQLKARRQFDDTKKRVHKYEDEVPEQIKPERYHPVMSSSKFTKIAKQYGYEQNSQDYDYPTSRRNEFTDTYPGEPKNPFREVQLHYTPDGQYKNLLSEEGFEGLEQNLNEGDKANRSYYSSGYNETTMLDNPYPDTVYKAPVPPENLVNKNSKGKELPKEIDPYLPLETNLKNTKQFPNNYFSYVTGNDDENIEKVALEELYDDFGHLGQYSPSPGRL
jgi:hypothetical protein